MILIVIILICYLIGSIPFAYLYVKALKGVDIRTVGSGNVGATNVGRIAGKKGFISVFLLDMLKGFVPILVIKYFYSEQPYFLIASAVSLILGHSYTIFLNFKGGKGVATSVGIFLGLSPVLLLLGVVVFTIAVYLSKTVSIGSISASAFMGVFVFFTNLPTEIKWFTFIIAIFVIYKHKSNIKRILNGTENKIGEKAK
jgi:glycerol-3-phosphate acyltransferase PlsY